MKTTKTNPAGCQLSLSNEASGSLATVGAAAFGAVFTLPVAVDAAVVYSGVQNINVTLPGSQRWASINSAAGVDAATAPLDLNFDAVDDFQMVVRQSAFNSSSRDGTASLYGLGGNQFVIGGSEGFGVQNLSQSNIVNGQQTFGSEGILREVEIFEGATYVNGQFANGVSGYVGVKFDIAGNDHFGWIELRVDDGPGGFPVSITVNRWAYEGTPGVPIHVPDTFSAEVPEANPGLVLLAAGGTGLVAWRLRRRKDANQAVKV
jgi:hypothetical protein